MWARNPILIGNPEIVVGRNVEKLIKEFMEARDALVLGLSKAGQDHFQISNVTGIPAHRIKRIQDSLGVPVPSMSEKYSEMYDKTARNQALKEMAEAGVCQRELAVEFDMSEVNVINVLKSTNANVARAKRKAAGNPNPATKDRNKKICDMFTQGETKETIAAAMGISTTRVGQILLENDLSPVLNKQQRKERQSKVIALLKQGIPYAEIAQQVNLSIPRVKELALVHGLGRRGAVDNKPA